MRFISASVTRSKESKVMGHGSWVRKKLSLVLQLASIIFLLTCPLPLAPVCSAETLERVVAYVNDNAITLSEFQENARKTRKTLGNVTDSEIINTMINNLLLVEEAGKMRLEAADKDELVHDYIDIKIKPFIRIREEEMERFYNESSGQFKGRDYLDVRDEIERYLLELDTNKQLKKHIEELRAKSDIKIQLKLAD